MSRVRFTRIIFVALLTGIAACATSRIDRSTASAPDPIQLDPPQEEYPSFFFQASCQVTCEGGEPQTLLSERAVFDAHDSPIQHANGGLAPTLSLRLGNRGDQACLDTAIRACGDVNRIQSVESLSLQSGQWKTPLPLDCSFKRACAISPYQDPQLLEKTRRLPDFDRFSLLNNNLFGTSNDCHHVISFKSCFGDCESDEAACGVTGGEYVETLMTPHPGATGSAQICMDALEQQFKEDQSPPAVRPILCRIYARKSILNAQLTDLSCTAYRINTDPCELYRGAAVK